MYVLSRPKDSCIPTENRSKPVPDLGTVVFGYIFFLNAHVVSITGRDCN